MSISSTKDRGSSQKNKSSIIPIPLSCSGSRDGSLPVSEEEEGVNGADGEALTEMEEDEEDKEDREDEEEEGVDRTQSL